MKDSPMVKGFLTIEAIDKETGTITQRFSDANVVTSSGIEKLTDALQGASASLDTFVFGNDVGTGTELFPESAKASYTSSTQNTLFTVSASNIVITNPSGNTMKAETVVSGSTLLNNQFQSEVSLNVTSGTFRFSDNTTFSYKRFPAIVISRMVDISITWEIEFINT